MNQTSTFLNAMPVDLDQFSKRSTLADVPAHEVVGLLGMAIDAAWEIKQFHLLTRIVETLAPTIDRSCMTPAQLCSLDFCLCNAWNGIKILSSPTKGGGWEWDSRAIEQETICIRRAIASEGLFDQPVLRICQIHTNLANCYNTTGRFVDALIEWDRALLIEPGFGMAKGNRAVGLWTYAKSVYDRGHALLLAREAWAQLEPSGLKDLEAGAGSYFTKVRDEIERATPPEVFAIPFDSNSFDLGDSSSEQAYREWCLANRLFLNPLNDLGKVRVAAQDVLTCPSIVANVGEGPRFHDFMNQIKQEYCSARWFVYEATREHAPHFSDSAVLLYNTLDYPSYGLRTEQLKLGFRALYSLFDKVAFFLNAYLNLGIPERNVSFRGLWYVKQNRQKGIRPEFSERENWPLRGLFWLGKDLFENSDGFRDVINPAARRLSDLRNHLEHKYLKLHSELWGGPDSSTFNDGLAVSWSRNEFEETTIHLLRTVRASIIYLILGIHREELLRAHDRGPDKTTPPMELDTWEDNWKT